MAGATNAVEIVDDLLGRAVRLGAGDVHFDPLDTCMLVRFRCDGQLHDVEELPAEVAPNIVGRLKSLAGLLTYRLDVPQEGALRMPAAHDNGSVDFRVATFPTVRGERVVVRIFRPEAAGMAPEELGLGKDIVTTLQNAVAGPDGLIIVTGPAGSGKTTTLYSLLEHIRRRDPGRSVITLEDPVERRIDRVTQIQVNPYGELNYIRCMRSILRQDPQVIMLGEIRDAETARVCAEAALTGHLILTTMHSGNATGALVRLLEMGVAAYQLVSAVSVIVGQRLLRKLCTPCAGNGCSECLHCGYLGRTACAEAISMNEDLRSAILRSAPTSQLRDAAAPVAGDLSTAAKRLVTTGVTTAEEVQRVLGNDV